MSIPTAGDARGGDIEVIAARPRKVTSRGAATRLLILQTAVEVVAGVGIHAMNVQMITDRSGVARGSILHQFPTRLALLVGVFEHCAACLLRSLRAHCAVGGDASQPLDGMADFMRDQMSDEHGITLQQIRDAAHWDGELLAQFVSLSEAFFEDYVACISALAERAGIRSVEALKAPIFLTMHGASELSVIGRLQGDQGDSELFEAICGELRHNWTAAVGRVRNSE